MSHHYYRLIDTKVMASTSPFRERLPNTSLEPLLKALTEKPFRLGCIGDYLLQNTNYVLLR